MRQSHNKTKPILSIIASFLLLACIVGAVLYWNADDETVTSDEPSVTDISTLPAYEDFNSPYVVVNKNKPYFGEDDYTTEPFEEYSDLDSLGRCGAAFVNACLDIMPTEERGNIGTIKPSGWNQAKYEGIINSNPPYLYNRCHLIGYQISAENANEKNLITGTRYMNVSGMLSFENKVVAFIHNGEQEGKKRHVLYRVTPEFEGDNLVASGVLMEASSVEDKGKGLSFCVYVFNVQPGVIIDYSDGSSRLE